MFLGTQSKVGKKSAMTKKYHDDDNDDELFSGMIDRHKAFSLISHWDHCQRFLQSQFSSTTKAGTESAQNQSLGLAE